MTKLAGLPAAALAAFSLVLAGCSEQTPGVPHPLYERPDSAGGVAIPGLRATSPALLYVSQPTEHRVRIYDQSGSDQSPVGTLTSGLTTPEGLWVAGNHDLYVADFGASKIPVFRRGASKPYKTLADPGEEPEGVIVDTDGTVYVTNFQTPKERAGSVSVYAHGSVKPTSKLSVPNDIDVLFDALDDKHDLFIGYTSTTGPFEGRFKGGHGPLQQLHLAVQFPSGMEFDRTQDLAIVDEAIGQLDVFELPNPSPVIQITPSAGGTLVDLALNAANSEVYLSDSTTGAVYEYTYPRGVLADTITNGLDKQRGYPAGLAVDPSPPF